MLWIGIDIGGTFTDAVVYDQASGEVRSAKSPTTPDDPARGVMDVITAMDVNLADVARFRHGATVATNAALERKGANLGVLTTAGFKDVLIIGRGNRVELYDIRAVRPPGLVKRSQVLEVPERLDAGGEVLRPLDEAAVAQAAERFAGLGVDAVAVCFLHAYANSTHEQGARDILARTLDVPISCSSEVLPQHREFERFATTALNAYVAPRMAQYLSRLEAGLREGGLEPAPEIMSSSGGSWPFERMAKLPVNSMLSGPAGGVIGSVAYSSALGVRDFITYDMGGTSTDVALVRDGAYGLAMEGEVGGIPNRAPQIEINTVGAGGGSVAYLDEGGFLNVGPRSAGAVPGPACYGRGGTEPTVTDANVVLGRFRPTERLGGELEIDVAAAHCAIAELADRLDLSPPEMAEGVVRIAVTRMTGAIKEISVMRGIDPRDLSLLSYGGAGPLHAALIARELGIKEVVVPALPGAFSAFGLLVAEPRVDFTRTRLMALADTPLEAIREMFESLRVEGERALGAQGFSPADIRYEYAADMRFVGQAFELTTPFDVAATSLSPLREAFAKVYEERYTHADEGEVEIVSFRLSAHGAVASPTLPPVAALQAMPDPVGTRPVYFDGAERGTPIYHRSALGPGADIAGPAIVDEPGSTILVPPDASLGCLATGALVIRTGAAA